MTLSWKVLVGDDPKIHVYEYVKSMRWRLGIRDPYAILGVAGFGELGSKTYLAY